MSPSGAVTGIHSSNAFTGDSLLYGVGWAHLITTASGAYTALWDTSGTYAASSVSFKAASRGGGTPLNACDLATPFGTIDSADVTLAVNMALGTTPCTANVEGPRICTVVTVQRVINASQGQPCLVYNPTAPPVIISAATASGTVGSAFSYQIGATNTPNSYGAGGLPAGLSVNTGTGSISGTPTAAGTSTVILSATNSSGTGNANLTVTIGAAPPVITSATTAGGTVGRVFSYQIMATNAPTSYNATGLPAGLSINMTTGLISGTPTSAGTSSITLSAANGAGTGQSTLTLTLTASGGGHSVTLNWGASTSPNATGYNIYRGTTSGGPYNKVNVAPGNQTSYVDNSVQAGQSYYYVVTTVDNSGNEGGFSNQTIAVIPSP
ncbi:MAG: putative Ig domain-containing protein [Bryobacteraceae bacterium]